MTGWSIYRTYSQAMRMILIARATQEGWTPGAWFRVEYVPIDPIVEEAWDDEMQNIADLFDDDTLDDDDDDEEC